MSEILPLNKQPGFLILSEGSILLQHTGSDSPRLLSCTDSLGSVTSVSSCPGQDGDILAVVDNGHLYQIRLSADTATLLPAPSQLAGVAASPNHTAILDTQGRVFSKGVPPMVGTLNKCEQFEKIRFPTGHEVIQLETGGDFTVALVRRREPGVTSPATPDTNLLQTLDLERVSCPLGLAVNSESSPRRDERHSEITAKELVVDQNSVAKDS